jgi:hypothetical protein
MKSVFNLSVNMFPKEEAAENNDDRLSFTRV